MSQNGSTVDNLAYLIGRDDTAEVRKELMMMKYRLGPDRAIRVAQQLSNLGPDAIQHLIQDPRLEANCIAGDGIVNEALSTFSTPTIVIPTQDQTIPTSSQSANHGIHQSHPGRLTSLTRSKSDVSRPSKPEKLHVRCKRMECAQHRPFKKPRGLREHFVLKHEMSIDQARHEAESAFKPEHGTFSQPQHLKPPEALFATARIQVQSNDACSMAPRLSPDFAAEQAPFRTSISPDNAGGQVQRISPRAQQSSPQEHHNSFRPHLQASTTSSLRPDQDLMSSDAIAIHMPANNWSNHLNHRDNDFLLSPGQQYPYTPSIEIQSDIDTPQYSSLDGSHCFPPSWQ